MSNFPYTVKYEFLSSNGTWVEDEDGFFNKKHAERWADELKTWKDVRNVTIVNEHKGPE